MTHPYKILDTSNIYSPALIFYRDFIEKNIRICLEMAGSTDRLRPHVKTHKCREIVQMELDHGIKKHKCATLAEAEMLAMCGVTDILLAYNLVGPNSQRMLELCNIFPECQFSTLIDSSKAAKSLSDAFATSERSLNVLLDADVGQHRTGISLDDNAYALYELANDLPGIKPIGLHIYDGHNHQSDITERTAAVQAQMETVMRFRTKLIDNSYTVSTIVVGGTPTFPVYAKMDIPGLECAPGTCILHDNGYGSRFPDMDRFTPAAVLLTRVISKPTDKRMTLDLGYKAIASDPPAGKRLTLLDIPEYEAVLQNEEHLVIESSFASKYDIGDELYAIPTHVCPTSALHQFAYVVVDGQLVDRWEIVGRDRMITV